MTLDMRKSVYKPMELKLDSQGGEIVLHIPAPTKAEWDDYVAQETEALKGNKIQKWTGEAALLILNANKEGEKFTAEDLEDMPYPSLRELVKAYVGWVQGTLKN